MNYVLEARAALPNFEAERRYVLTEREYAKRQLEGMKGSKRWLGPVLDGVRREDWRRYIRGLDAYEKKLEERRAEIKAGLVPFMLRVINAGEQDDTGVKVHVTVQEGSLTEKPKPLTRPVRIDGTPHKAWKLQWPPKGFVRRNLRVAAHTIRAEFSALPAGDSALLVNDVLHLRCHAATRMFFTIDSAHVHGERGEVDLGQAEQTAI